MEGCKKEHYSYISDVALTTLEATKKSSANVYRLQRI